MALCRCIGEGAFRCSLTLSPRDLPDSPMYELELCMCGPLVLVNNSSLFGLVVLVLGIDQGCS